MNQIIESLFWYPNPYTFKVGILEDDIFIEKETPYEICEGCINFTEGDEKAVVAILDEYNIIKSYII